MENGFFSLKGLVEDKLVEKYGQWKESTTFHFSESGKCSRQRIFKRRNVKPVELTKENIKSLGTFEIGHAYHKFIQYTVKESKFCLTEQRVLSKDEQFSGYFDLLIRLEDKYLLYDIKTVHGYAIKRIIKGEINESYKMQLCNYYLELKEKYEPIECRLLFISRDNFGMPDDVGVPMTDELIEKTTKDREGILQDWEIFEKDGQLPPQIPDDDEGIWACNPLYCSYFEHCGRTTEWLNEVKKKKKEAK